MARSWEGVVLCSERDFPVGRKTGGLSRCVGPVTGMGAEIEAKQSVKSRRKSGVKCRVTSSPVA